MATAMSWLKVAPTLTTTLKKRKNEEDRATTTLKKTPPTLKKVNPTLKKARGILSTFSLETPTVMVEMDHPYLAPSFIVPIPADYSIQFLKEKGLSRSDKTYLFEVDSGARYEIQFLGGGWKKISMAENLRRNDVVLFQLVKQRNFKVYIVRAESIEDEIQKLTISKKPLLKELEDLEKEAENFKRIASEDWCLKETQTLDTFEVFLGENAVTLSEEVRVKYYNLCSSQRSLLHSNVATKKATFLALAIEEVVEIADGIRSSVVPSTELDRWKTLLVTCESLGMEVKFLQDRLKKLMDIEVNPARIVELGNQVKSIEDEIQKLTISKKQLLRELEDLEKKAENFKRIASEDWCLKETGDANN